MRYRLATIVCLLLSSSCASRPEPPSAWRVRFGPVIGTELITGHGATGGTAWLATGTDALIRVDLVTATHLRSAIHPLAPGEHTWGLAATEANGLWLLIGRDVLAQVSPSGRILRRVPLSEPHVGVFAVGNALVYQLMNFDPPVPALFTGGMDGSERRAWGSVQTRSMPLARGAVAALNLVSCGGAAGDWTPCWFPDEAGLTLTSRLGITERLALPDLATVAPEVLLASANPRRPVRDAFALAHGDVWVLGSGKTPPGQPEDRIGGWLLARYTHDGRQLQQITLNEPARVILSASEDSCTLLSWDGHVVEVRP